MRRGWPEGSRNLSRASGMEANRNESGRGRRGTVGRPRVLDAEMRGTVKLLLGIGCSLKVAARVAGCAPCTVRREMLRDPTFGDELRKARHGARAGFVLNLINAAQTSASAADCLRSRVLEAIDGAPPPPRNPSCGDTPTMVQPARKIGCNFALHAMRSLENSRSAAPQKRKIDFHFRDIFSAKARKIKAPAAGRFHDAPRVCRRAAGEKRTC